MASDDRLAGPVELVEQFDQPLLRAGVEAVRGLVQKQDLGVDRKDGGKGDLLLLAAAQIVGRAFGERAETQHGQGVVDPGEDLLAGQVEVQRPEGDFVTHARAEELRVGALKNDADTPPEGLGRRLVVQGAVVDAPAEGRDGAVGGLHETGDHLEQGRLARAIGAEDAESLATVDREIDRGERLDPGTVLVPHAGQAEHRGLRGRLERRLPAGSHQRPAVSSKTRSATRPAAATALQARSSRPRRQSCSVRASPV